MNRLLLVKALKVATLVGTALLVINQYDALFDDAELRVVPAILTYCVPFAVFMAGQLSNRQNRSTVQR
ncbi:nitrate/nitrite transporter NrtS [Neptunomonas qingdaonensis]|uniref:Methyl-accepting chemotaxis protein n=1 Tax=Neptunomonas qingdaonensis TaxID=1045558 RepID=A0A1I2P0W6_9GAMM|nr:nitrate/nitrite transporter NrtS [Neptunomonas qingdaonensis]SFG09668.1 methyl-accepting chemotaxis protein [Neptunomonas qingdaonensis]